MRLISILPAAAAAIVAASSPAPASAAETLSLPHFRSIELRGGGRVLLRHGARQRVTISEGSSQFTRIRVERWGGQERLAIDACNERCPQRYQLTIVVETPDVEAVAVKGGGAITAEGGFGRQGNVAAAVNGGGSIDLRAVPVANMAAAVHGGGNLLVRAERTLAAAVNGGGSIRYWGDPQVTTAINGGGSVNRGR